MLHLTCSNIFIGFVILLFYFYSEQKRILFCTKNGQKMSKLLRGIAAGWGAKKLGGGCLSTIVIFIILWWLLGHFGIFK